MGKDSAEQLPSKDLQRRFWNDWFRARESMGLFSLQERHGDTVLALLQSLKLEKPEILEVGCGTGWLSEQLVGFGSVTAIDLADEFVNRAAARVPEVRFLAGDFLDMDLPSGKYDVAISIQTLAHVADQAAFVNRTAEVLRDEGFLIITTQNRLVLERMDVVQQAEGHIRHWLSMHRLKKLLRQRFHILYATTVVPEGHRGLLRFVNSHKVNAVASILATPQKVERFKEWAGLGRTLVALGQKI